MTIKRDAPVYLITSGLMYLPSVAPMKTEMMVTMRYAETEPSKTDRGLFDEAAMPMPTNCVLSANSAKKTAPNVA